VGLAAKPNAVIANAVLAIEIILRNTGFASPIWCEAANLRYARIGLLTDGQRVMRITILDVLE
jgi:hypothetical protein